jgi:hypothetical protein
LQTDEIIAKLSLKKFVPIKKKTFIRFIVKVGESLSHAVGEKADRAEEFEVRDTVLPTLCNNCRKINVKKPHSKIIWLYKYRQSTKKCLLVICNGNNAYTDKKRKETIPYIFKEIQMGSGVKSYMRKGFLKKEEMCKYVVIYEEAVSHI